MNSQSPFSRFLVYAPAALFFCCAPLEAQTLTPTPALEPTLTVTSTATLDVPPSPTVTPTGTLTPSTPTFTPTITPSPTFTATPTSTFTPTPTVTSTPGISKFSVSSKADGQGQINFNWGNTLPADEAFLKIYTSGFRIVREFEFSPTESAGYLTAENHEFTWDGKDENARAMPSGIYLCFIELSIGKKQYEASGKTEIP
jgi:hypothetical protein